ncbi:hypothetical protein EF906_20125, partial [Streptomyces sp. WAC08241]
MIRGIRGVTTAAALLALAAATPGAAHARQPSPGAPATATATATAQGSRHGNPELPPGWRVAGTGAQRQLVWTSSAPVPMGDARVEFHAGDRLLGRPAADPDGHTFRLPLGDARLDGDDRLRVTAGGKRLDAAAPSARL